MALNLITNIGTELSLSSQWGDLSTVLDQVKTGIGNKIRVHSLTNWDSSTTKPEIAEGSLFDVGGSLYLADSDTALTDEDGLIDGTCHIKLVPAVDGLTVVPTLTNDSIPAWDETKHGWYDGADCFLPYEFTKASSVYSDKKEYTNQDKTTKETSEGELETGNIFRGSLAFSSSTGIDGVDIYNTLDTLLPNVNDAMSASGCTRATTGIDKFNIYSFIYRNSSTSFLLRSSYWDGSDMNRETDTITASSGTFTAEGQISFSGIKFVYSA
jgi:hypothetical protein